MYGLAELFQVLAHATAQRLIQLLGLLLHVMSPLALLIVVAPLVVAVCL